MSRSRSRSDGSRSRKKRRRRRKSRSQSRRKSERKKSRSRSPSPAQRQQGAVFRTASRSPGGRDFCKDFNRGECIRGPGCKFSHNFKPAIPDKGLANRPVEPPRNSGSRASGGEAFTLTYDWRGKELCGDFKRNDCRRADKCRYSHGDGHPLPAPPPHIGYGMPGMPGYPPGMPMMGMMPPGMMGMMPHGVPPMMMPPHMMGMMAPGGMPPHMMHMPPGARYPFAGNPAQNKSGPTAASLSPSRRKNGEEHIPMHIPIDEAEL